MKKQGVACLLGQTYEVSCRRCLQLSKSRDLTFVNVAHELVSHAGVAVSICHQTIVLVYSTNTLFVYFIIS